MEVSAQLGSGLAVLGVLLLFGILYATAIHYLNERGYMEGYTAICVVFGVGVTITINQFNYIENDPSLDFLFELAGFVASGTPMIVNNIMEYVTRRAQAERDAVEQAIS